MGTFYSDGCSPSDTFSNKEAEEECIGLLVQVLAAQLEQATTGLDVLSEYMAKHSQVQACADDSLADTTSTFEADEEFSGLLMQDLVLQEVPANPGC